MSKEKIEPNSAEDVGAEPSTEARDRSAAEKTPKRAFGRKGVLLILGFTVAALVVVFLAVFVLYRTGAIDNYVEGEFADAFADMGIEFKADEFRINASPLNITVRNAVFVNKKTGAKLGGVRKAVFGLTVLDLYALRPARNVDIDTAVIEGLEVRVDVDSDGRSNFEGVEIKPPKNFVKFRYSSSRISVRDSALRFGDKTRKISGDAEDLLITLAPADTGKDDPPLRFRFEVRSKRASFAYNGKKIRPVDVKGAGVLDETGAEVESLEIGSPIGSSVINGRISGWDSPSYDLKIVSSVDLTQASGIFPLGTAIVGVGNFEGRVSGKGEKYKIKGEVRSDSLAAANVRLKAFRVNASAKGEGSAYEANGKAIAELLTFEDFRFSYPQLTGNIRGTGTDFRWFGALQAASLFSPVGTIGGLYLNDALAEYKDGRLTADLRNVRARKFESPEARLESIQTPRIRIVSAGGVTVTNVQTARASKLETRGAALTGVLVNSIEIRSGNERTDVRAANVRSDTLTAGDVRLKDVSASDITSVNSGGVTEITAKRVESEASETASARVGKVAASDLKVRVSGDLTTVSSPKMTIARVETDSAVIGSLNIAGVRLSVRNGRIEGSTNDFEIGTVDLKQNGRLEKVAVFKPVFVLESAGRYRASLDMTLGGGLLGSVKLGAASASVTADNDRIVFDDLKAEVMDGRVNGRAVIAMKDAVRSELRADFADLDIAKLLALQGGRITPIDGTTAGQVDLTFAGTDYRRASGTLSADIAATAGDDERGLIPVKGRVSVKAADGLFAIETVRLGTDKSEFTADGRFDLVRDDSDLSLAVRSRDAGEVDRIIRILELAPALGQQLDSYDGHFSGNFGFDGRVTGNISAPRIDGRASLDSIILRGKDLGSLVSDIAVTQESVRLSNGSLSESGDGKITFDIEIPNFGENNTSVQAKLADYAIGKLLTALPVSFLPESFRDLEAKTSGSLDLSGLPNKMQGRATLHAGKGTLRGQTFDSLTSTINFDGTLVKVERLDATFGSGSLSAGGSYRTDSTAFDIRAVAKRVPLARIRPFLPQDTRIPEIVGEVDLDARASGLSNDTTTYAINFKGSGSGIALNGMSFGNVSFEGRTVNKFLTASVTTHLSGHDQVIRATLDFAGESVPMTAQTTLAKTPLGPYIAIFRPPDPNRVKIGGSATGAVNLAGDLTKIDTEGNRVFTTEKLRGTADFDEFALLIGETPLVATSDISLSFSFDDVSVENARFSGGGTDLVVNGTKALSDGGVNDLAINGRINLRVLNAISRNIFFSGLADVEVSLTGANRTARLNGKSQLKRGSVSTFVGSERVTMERMEGCVLFNTSHIQIGCNDSGSVSREITGKVGGGSVRVSGEVLLSNSLQVRTYRLEIVGNGITAPLPIDFVTTGNANLEITGGRDGDQFNNFVAGTFYARRSVYKKDIDLADFISGRRDATLSQADSDTSFFVNTDLDIRILGRDALIVRNNLADLTASADLRLTGDVANPRLTGRITATRGVIFFRDDRYDVQRGVLIFPPNTLIEPVINLQAESQIGGYQIFVSLSGKLTDEDLLIADVRSNPSLPRVDVVSLITTGSLSNTGTGIPTYAQSGLNTAAEILTDEIINKPVTRATDKLFGLNKFNLDPIVSGRTGNPTARLTVGRQINRNLLVRYSTNLSQEQDQVLAVEYRLSNRLSFVARYKQKSISNVTRRRKSFLVEIRLRKRF